MQVMRDSASIRGSVTALSDSSLTHLIARRIDELAEYGEDLAELCRAIDANTDAAFGGGWG